MSVKYIQSAKNPQIKQWKKLLTKKERELTGTYLIEGFHLVEEALKHDDLVSQVIIREGLDLPQSWNLGQDEVITLSEDAAKALSETETNQGVFAICHVAKTTIDLQKHHSFLLLDGVQDPGNIGTMIRTADAAGIDAVILGNGTVDVYNPKVLRSAQGSHFNIAIEKKDLQEFVMDLKTAGIPIYGTALEGAVEYTTVSPSNRYALIVGNEGNGVTGELLQETDQNLYIPIYGKSESLNVAVATGILLYYMKMGNRTS